MNDVQGPCLGALYGVMYNSTLLIVGVSVDVQPEYGVLSYAEIQTHFPTEVDFCGLVTFMDIADNEPPSSVINTLKVQLIVHIKSVVLCVELLLLCTQKYLLYLVKQQL